MTLTPNDEVAAAQLALLWGFRPAEVAEDACAMDACAMKCHETIEKWQTLPLESLFRPKVPHMTVVLAPPVCR